MCSCKFRDGESCVKTVFASGKTENKECSFAYHENEDVTCNKFKEGKHKKQVFIDTETQGLFKFNVESYEQQQIDEARIRLEQHYREISSYESYARKRY